MMIFYFHTSQKHDRLLRRVLFSSSLPPPYHFSCPTPELKTEEGYSADIVQTFIPGDICLHNVCTMSAQCPHNISLVRHISFRDVLRTLCGHNLSPGIYVRSSFSSENSNLYSRRLYKAL